uniref:Integrase catalytic domain-containing protein n=1 Tax=Strigamia maritima TaxID=126957 RepID=T1IH84_STRMM
MSMQEIKDMQHLDPNLSVIIDWLEKETVEPNHWSKIPAIMAKRKADYTLSWADIVPLRNAKIPTIAPAIMRFFHTHGCPRFIVSDNGKQFASDIYNSLCEEAGVTPLRTSPYHPTLIIPRESTEI